MTEKNHATLAELELGLETVLQSPKQVGVLELIVRRPHIGAREILQDGLLSLSEGLVGDNWRTRGSPRTPDGSSHPDCQLNIMSSRAIELLAQDRERWHLAGDQLFVDLDLSRDNLPPGTRLEIGEAVIQITDQPHTGCDKFAARFGMDALKLVNSALGGQLQLRGICAKVVRPGAIRAGDTVRKK